MKGTLVIIGTGLVGGLTAFGVVGAADVDAVPRAQTLVLPSGRYIAIVFTGTGIGDASPATGVIRVGRDQFLVNIGPGSTFAIPFGDGWELEKDAEIRLTNGVGPVSTVPMAWAVTSSGPVALRPK